MGEIFVNNATYKRLFSKRLIQLNGIQMNNPIRKWTEDINTFIQRKHTESQEAHV